MPQCEGGSNYPPEAYAPDGILWWRLTTAPGSNRSFGDEQKISAWLAFNRAKGETFTMKQLRSALGEDALPNDAEHLNRRLRNLRQRDGWKIPSQKDDARLAHDEYRVIDIGWHPGTGLSRPRSDVPSDKTRRLVFERDDYTCAICGIAGGERYDDLPAKVARLTLGHRIAGKRLNSKATLDELQTECARCNEVLRDQVPDPLTLEELRPRIIHLKKREKEHLLSWLRSGRRCPSRLDKVYGEARKLSSGERQSLISELNLAVGK